MPPKEKKEKKEKTPVPRRVYKKKESKVDKMEQVEEEKDEEKEEEKQEEKEEEKQEEKEEEKDKRVDLPQLPNQIRPFDRVPEQRIGENTELFNRSILAKTLSLPMSRVGGNLKEMLRHEVSQLVEGKCIVDGYVKKHSVEILSYSCGLVRGNNVIFEVSYSCEVFLPCAGMILSECVITEILESAGIEVKSKLSPNIFIVYIYQDHNFEDNEFKGRIGDTVSINVVDYRFEIYDEVITIMGEIV